MKHLLLATCFFSLSVSAQHNFYIGDAYSRNIVKLNVLGLPSKMISLKYERLRLDKTTTFDVGVNYMVKGNVPFLNLFNHYIKSDKSRQTLANTKVSSISIIPEVRFYLTNVDAEAIYVAPFVRYDNYKATIDYHYQYYDTTQNIALSGVLEGFGVGISAGKQWKLGNNWYLDWTVLNIMYQIHAGKFENKRDLTFDEQHYIKNGLESFEFKNADITIDVDDRGALFRIKANRFIPRMAISFGKRF